MTMDTFPDLGSLTDQELKDLIQQLTEEEMEVSYQRRILHGKIDILRAELVNRLRKKHEGGEDVITGDDVQQLTDILAGRGPAADDDQSQRRGGSASPWPVHCPECGFVNAEGANYCQNCGAFLGAREADGATTRRRRPTGSTRPASSSPVEIEDVAARGARARHPRRRRPRRARASRSTASA